MKLLLKVCTRMWQTINQVIGWFNNNQGFVIAILTTLYVLTTIGLWLAMRHSNKLTKESMMRFYRPFITIDLQPDKDLLYLRLKNTGVIPAVDVLVQFEEQIRIYNNNMLNETIRNLTIVGPGQEIKFFLDKKDSFIKRNNEIQFITGKLSYKSPLSNTYEYEEKIHINIKLYNEVIIIRG